MAKAKKVVYAEGMYTKANGDAVYYLQGPAGEGDRIEFSSYESMKAYTVDPEKDQEVAQAEADIQSQIDALEQKKKDVEAQKQADADAAKAAE
jgi:hypothetical protein